MRRCADSMDRECGARLQAMSRRMEDAEGAVWTVGRRQVVFVQSRSLMSCCEGVTVPTHKTPALDGGGVG